MAAELKRGADQVGVDLTDEEVRRLADEIEDGHATVSAAEALGASRGE